MDLSNDLLFIRNIVGKDMLDNYPNLFPNTPDFFHAVYFLTKDYRINN